MKKLDVTIKSIAEKAGVSISTIACDGSSFTLNVTSGNYNNNIWLNAKTGDTRNAGSVSGGSNQNFPPPDTLTDWVLILRS